MISSGGGAISRVQPMARPPDATALRRLLETTTHPGKLATVSRDGAPTIVPIWFVVDGDDVVFTTGATSAKARNLRRDPRAALCVDEVEFPYGFVTVRGPVTIEEAAPDL